MVFELGEKMTTLINTFSFLDGSTVFNAKFLRDKAHDNNLIHRQ